MSRLRRILLGVLLAAFGPLVHAQEYPSRPVRLIVPFPPGGSTDIYARLIARELTATWGQTVVVDNRAGGTGIIGTLTARQAAPDGYTLLFTSNTSHVLGPLLRSPPPFDPIADFTPLTMAVRFPLYLIVNPSIPVRSVAEFVAHARASQGRLNYASSGEGGYSHLAALLFNTSTEITATHLPYKGASPAQQAVVAGEAQYRFDNIGTSYPLVLAGKLRGLAITGKSRAAAVPEVQTLSELGVRGLEDVYTWLGLLAPARLPPALAAQVSGEAIRIMQAPDMAKRVVRDGYEVVASTPAQFASDVRSETNTASRVIRSHGIKAQ